jgi:hypothetical protein
MITHRRDLINNADKWWLAGGVNSKDCVAAYQAVAAESYATSKVNLANPGTNSAVDGSSYPDWNGDYGWLISSGQYLVLPKFLQTYTIICRYSSAAVVPGAGVLFGLLSGSGMYYMPIRTDNTRTCVNGTNNNAGVVADVKADGIIAIAGTKAYFDGADLGVTLSAAALPDLNVYLGRLNFSVALPMKYVQVQAVAIYNRTLTPLEIASLTAAIKRINEKNQLPKPNADIFIIAGQSNGSGMVTNNQSYSSTSINAYKYGKDGKFYNLTDPISKNTDYVFSVMNDSSGATLGSVWPLVATAITAQTGREVVFVPCAVGGKSLSTHWQPAANHRSDTTLYGCLINRADVVKKYGTMRAVLLWAGEGEVNTSMSQADYNTYLDTFANAINTDLGIPTMACKVQDCTAPSDETNVNAAVAEAWGDNANCITGPDLHGIATDDAWHIQGDAKAATAATLWANAIIAAFSW